MPELLPLRQTIAFDLTRMFIGGASTTPRGIDRVDMGYARRFLGDPDGPHLGLVPSWGGMGVLSRRDADRLARVVDGAWRETRPTADDAQFAWLTGLLTGSPGEPGTVPSALPIAKVRSRLLARYAAMVLHARMSPLRPAALAVPRGAIYVNTGQFLLGWGRFFAWMERRPDVKPVFMLHDLIPVLYPEYSGPILSRHHARALRTVARRARAMIATSQASADEIRDGLRDLGRADMPIHVVPLPVSDSLLAGARTGGLDTAEPYFVTVGSIDQRKNHILLFHVWRDMIRRADGPVPRLVVAGPPGLRTAGLRDAMARSPGLADRVTLVHGLSSPALRELVGSAAALLMPSFTEGFGLPIVEALAQGTPVVASDIPAHREVGGPHATYLDPLDGLAWQGEVLRRAEAAATGTGRSRPALGAYRPQTWTSYFEAVVPFLDAL